MFAVDRGHVETAPGASSPFMDETANNAYAVSLLKKWLILFGASFVILKDGTTRDTDLSVPVNQANALKVKFVLSVHTNSFSDPAANGFETCVQRNFYSGFTKQLADAVNGAYGEAAIPAGMKNRGIRQGDYYITRKTTMSAAILEMGFVSNQRDVQIMTSPGMLDKAMKLIAIKLMALDGQTINQPAPETPKPPVEPAPQPTPIPVPAKDFTAEEVTTLKQVIALYKKIKE
jgi:N-acetylmuramoyl-L-alanine amidase